MESFAGITKVCICFIDLPWRPLSLYLFTSSQFFVGLLLLSHMMFWNPHTWMWGLRSFDHSRSLHLFWQKFYSSKLFFVSNSLPYFAWDLYLQSWCIAAFRNVAEKQVISVNTTSNTPSVPQYRQRDLKFLWQFYSLSRPCIWTNFIYRPKWKLSANFSTRNFFEQIFLDLTFFFSHCILFLWLIRALRNNVRVWNLRVDNMILHLPCLKHSYTRDRCGTWSAPTRNFTQEIRHALHAASNYAPMTRTTSPCVWLIEMST